jgi:hypothetical protein
MLMGILIPAVLMSQTVRLFNSDNSGLPYNEIYCIAFDHEGNTWFGGQRDAGTGLAQVSVLAPDLETWSIYTQHDIGLGAAEDRVFYLSVDDENNKWFCTHFGVSRMKADGTAELIDITGLPDPYTRTVQTDAVGNVYVSIREDDREASCAWFSNDHGENWTCWGLDDMGFTLGYNDGRPEIYDLQHDSQGQLWVCTWYGVSYRDLGGTWHVIDAIEGYWTYAMTIDPDDHVWVPDNDTQDLYEIMPDGSITTHTAATIPPLENPINDLEADDNGHLWCALAGGGLLEILPDGSYNQYTVESTGGDFPENTLYDLEIEDDIIWIAADTTGVLRLEGFISSTSVEDGRVDTPMPQEMTLLSNYPNPFNPVTTIPFTLERASTIGLVVYNLQGEMVRRLVTGQYPAGFHTVTWDGRNSSDQPVASGIYLYRLETDQQTCCRRMTLLK